VKFWRALCEPALTVLSIRTSSMSSLPRREFLVTGAATFAALASGVSAFGSSVDSGSVAGGKISLPDEKMPSDTPEGAVPQPAPPDQRVGFAVVGLGRLSLDQILPAFGASKKARLVALVSGSPDKAALVAEQHGVKPSSIYSYERYESIRDNPEIKAVYIVLPNALHAEYTIRAAQAGKHVLCEKPMTTSVADAQRMIDACSQAKVKLMIGYRCQYEPYNRALIEAVQAKKIGAPGMINACNYQNQADIGQWRLKKALSGGGSLPDVGLYCLNSSRAVLAEEPMEVRASTWSPSNDPRFKEVEANVSFTLRFPSGAVANCSSSYALHESRQLWVHGPENDMHLANAFGYHGQELIISRQEGEITHSDRYTLAAKDQFALELDHMATCVTENLQPYTPGEEGLQDQKIMEAIYESARTNQAVQLTPPPTPTRGPAPARAA
jgi:predicted dehydrogenase